MPYKDPEKQKKAVRKAVEKYRGITGKVLHDIPPIVHALADPVEREKMRRIVASLDRDISGLGGKKENMLDLVYRGIGENAISLRQVKNLLTAF